MVAELPMKCVNRRVESGDSLCDTEALQLYVVAVALRSFLTESLTVVAPWLALSVQGHGDTT
jgi:hypothetical protein